MRPNDLERFVRKRLEKMFGVPLHKRKLVVGYDSNGKPQIHEFDVVSDDMSIIGEIKSGKCTGSNYNSALVDCVYLSKVKTKSKMLILTNKEFYEYFKHKSEGIIGKDISIIHIAPEVSPEKVIFSKL